MRFLRWLSRTPRAMGALLLLATLVGGEVADARHHLAREGCGTEEHSGGRENDCTCAALHAVALGIELAANLAPEAQDGTFAPDAIASAHREHRGAESAPRAPPRG